jgi:hypothetical protein
MGNYLGTDATGTSALGNYSGVWIATDNNVIGGTPAADRNVISGNAWAGLVIDGDNNTVQGNLIGADVTGTTAIPNGNGIGGGMLIGQSSDNNTIGGMALGAGNTIAFSNGPGVVVNGLQNRILGNRIFGNSGLGLDLKGDGLTANDPGDADNGPQPLAELPGAHLGPPGWDNLNRQRHARQRAEYNLPHRVLCQRCL